LSTIYGPQHTWSVSRLERYQTCGFLFFISHALGLEARSEPAEGLDARQLGSIYHAVLDRACTAIPQEALIGAEAALRPLVAAAAAEVLEEAPRVYGFRATPWWGQTQNEIIENVTATILELANSEFAFAEGEIWFDDGRHGRPTLCDGDDQLRLHGVIDRVDRSPDGRLRIIDYKLGGSSRYHHGALREGRLLQLPLYALAAKEALDLNDIAEGFYWHILQGKRSRFSLSGGDGLTANIDIAVAHAWQAVHRIRGGEFAPRVPQEGCPNYCPAAAFCAHYSPGFGL
jgi:ATP-dependent helicase/DNAse subunit B